MFTALEEELIGVFERGVDTPLADDAFNDLALRVFRFQCEALPAYGGFARSRGKAPVDVSRWQEIPAVPTRAFKALTLISGDTDDVEQVFRTSGTTGGEASRGEHHVRSLALYRASLLPNFRAHLLPESLGHHAIPPEVMAPEAVGLAGEPPVSLLSLIPSPEMAPDSSLSFMVDVALRELCGGNGGYFVDPEKGIDVAGLDRALRAAEEDDRAVLIVGTAFGFVHWLDELDGEEGRYRLPSGSRIMETGGFKGRSRAVPRDDLYDELNGRLGVPLRHIVNEYGMTELLSQFYEPVIQGGAPEAPSGRFHLPPPWVRTQVVDPMTLQAVREGAVGLLSHLDLANVGSVAAVLTEDLGQRVGSGFRLLGRAQDAEPRGCSLAMEELMAVVGNKT
jgi:hypothetical protein